MRHVIALVFDCFAIWLLSQVYEIFSIGFNINPTFAFLFGVCFVICFHMRTVNYLYWWSKHQ